MTTAKQIDRMRRLNAFLGKAVYRPVPSESKVENAESIVQAVIDRKIGFAYKEVKRYPIDSGRDLRAELCKLQKELQSPLYLDQDTQVWAIRDRIKEIKIALHDHELYDITARDQLYKNYIKIKSACELLQSEGILEYYYINGNGLFRARFAIARVTNHIEMIETRDMPILTLDDFNRELARIRNNELYKTSPSKVHVADLTITKRDSLTEHGTCHGILPYTEPHVTKGSGELDPYVLKQRDDDNEYFKLIQIEKYLKAEIMMMRDMNTVNCYA